ncbi:MAG TPA: tyrosine-type recombinase/integrase [Nitrososphaeraceae archaeon]|nr:tyrosine-type recombinase/integrase [Nitrososphaeraceae archaeon]
MQVLDTSSNKRCKTLGDKNPLLTLDKAETFLNSMGRNSKSSKRAYSSGLIHFNNFLNEYSDENLSKYNLETILKPLQTQQLDIYDLLDQFVSYLLRYHVAIPTLKLYVASIRSYLSYFDIDIVTSKFKRRVKIPKYFRDEEQPIDVSDIRTLLIKCTNKRLKAYLLLLASSGLRTIEAASLRLQDIDFSSSPTRITVRKEYSKTRRSRTVYCSDEATEFLQNFLNQIEEEGGKKNPNDCVFSVYKGHTDPKLIYFKMLHQFEKLQKAIGGDMDARKLDDGVGRRHKITLHSLRRFCKGVISDQAGTDYSE